MRRDSLEWQSKKEQRTFITDKAAFRLLYDNVQDFAKAASLVESEIRQLGLRQDKPDFMQVINGRASGEMWLSMKTVSHFNLGVALELMLKLLLALQGKGFLPIHDLTKLYDDLPEPVQEWLESTYQDRLKMRHGYDLFAFNNQPQPPPLPRLPDRDLSSLRGLFEYLDQDVRLFEKRYASELVQKHEWDQYLSDLSMFLEFIEHVLWEIKA